MRTQTDDSRRRFGRIGQRFGRVGAAYSGGARDGAAEGITRAQLTAKECMVDSGARETCSRRRDASCDSKL